jgi:hypothetical protein
MLNIQRPPTFVYKTMPKVDQVLSDSTVLYCMYLHYPVKGQVPCSVQVSTVQYM